MKEFYTSIYQSGNHIHVRGIGADGEPFAKKNVFEPYIFVDANKDHGYKDIHGNFVKKVNFENMNEAKDYLKKFDDVSGMRILGLTHWTYLYIYEHYMDIEPDMEKIKVYYLDIEVQSDDGFPKPENASKPVTAIALTDKQRKICFGTGDYKPPKGQKDIYYIKCDNERALLHKFLEIWQKISLDVISGWNIKTFDIPYLVNRIRKVLGEDYVKQLSPWGSVRQSNMKGMNGEEIQTYNIAGISNLDYMVLYKKFQLEPRESYKLDSVCEVELGEKKLDYSEYSTLNELYLKNHQKFIEYNIRDNDLVMALEAKLGYIAQAMTIAYDAKVNYEDAITSVLLWDVISHNYLMSKNIVVKPKVAETYDESIVGAYVKEPVVGMHEWVVSFDLNSLYSHIIMQYNIGPDTYLSKNESMKYSNLIQNANVENFLHQKLDLGSTMKADRVNMTPNGAVYTHEKPSFFSEILQTMYDKRVQYKSEMNAKRREVEAIKEALKGDGDAKFRPERLERKAELEIDIVRLDNMQGSLKIILNSAYGSFANKYFRWFSRDNAEAITMSGQLAIRWAERAVNEYLNNLLKTDIDYILASDTDSLYVDMSAFVKRYFKNGGDTNKIISFIDSICNDKMQGVINKAYDDLAEYTNSYAQKMVMKRENIADKAIWLAKKKYIMNVWDSEGVRYKEPKLKMMGIEAIRSSTPTVCRKYIAEAIRLIIKGDEGVVRDYIMDKKNEFATLEFDQIAFPRSVNFMMGANKQTWKDSVTLYKKGTPIQVRAAFVYNKYLEENNLTNKYEVIRSGDKIKFCYMKLPNPIKENVIGAPRDLPEEANLHQYIDYNLQYDKAFLAPMRTILEAVNWSISTQEKSATLEAFL